MSAAFFDLDGTLIMDQSLYHFLSHPRVNALSYKLLFYRMVVMYGLYKLRLANPVLLREMWMNGGAALLKGWTRTQVEEAADWLVNSHEQRPDIVARLQTHKANGDKVVVISGMFEDVVKRFSAKFGADDYIGTPLLYEGDVCVGRLGIEHSITGPLKRGLMQDYLRDHGIDLDLSACYAYADSHSDVEMLSAVGHPVATYPDAELLALAQERGWTILSA